MPITSASFLRPVMPGDSLLTDSIPQIAFIGRSNVGKSTLINTITGKKGIARSSSLPGCTEDINFFSINNAVYFVDLPGYGYAKGSHTKRDSIRDKIIGYLTYGHIKKQTIVLILDAKVGATADDKDILLMLEEFNKKIVVVANKIDKVKNNDVKKAIQNIQDAVGPHTVIPFSSEKKIGVSALTEILLKK